MGGVARSPADRGRAGIDARYQRALFQRARRLREEDLEIPGGAAQSGTARRRVGGGAGGGDLGRRRHRQRDLLRRRGVPRSGGGQNPLLGSRRKGRRASPIRCMARSASPSSTSCIATRCARWPGATISAPRATGRSSSASWSPPAAPTNCGRWWPRADQRTDLHESRDMTMTAALRFDPIRLPPECEQLRKEVRAFLAEEIAAGTFDPHQPNREDTDAPEFSRKVGAKGWLGMTWPKKYGGHERSFLERYVVTEEMRVANAPTRRFFVADRQSGPVLLKYAPEHIKMDILPRICRGEVCFAIGMSEPNSGSDLFAAQDPRHQDRRRLSDQRHQDLDLVGAYRRLHDRDLPHLAADQGKPPPRPDAVSGQDEAAGHPGEPDRPDHRPVRIQRGGVHRLLRARRSRARRNRRRLEAGDLRARL